MPPVNPEAFFPVKKKQLEANMCLRVLIAFTAVCPLCNVTLSICSSEIANRAALTTSKLSLFYLGFKPLGESGMLSFPGYVEPHTGVHGAKWPKIAC